MSQERPAPFISIRRNLRLGRFRDWRLISTLLAGVSLAFVAYIARLSDVTHDAFHEMALVRAFFDSGQFPTDDVFAFTPTVSPTVHHEWGTGLILYWAAGASPLGLDGMAVLRLLVVAAIGLAAYRAARANGADPILIALCAPVVFPMLWVGFGTLRAQAFTLLFMLLQLLMQQSDWRGKRSWIAYWFIMYVVWLNMHAGFVVGLAMIALHICERWGAIVLWNDRTQSIQWNGLLELKRWSTAYLKCWHHLFLIPGIVCGVVINPWGIQYVPYLWRAITMPRPTIMEWQPLWMTPDSWTTMLAYFATIIALGYIAKNRRVIRLRGWFFCCLAAFMALKHIRHGSLYSIVWVALMPGWLTATAFGRCAIAHVRNNRTVFLRASFVLSILSLGYISCHPVWCVNVPSEDPKSPMVYPVGVVNYLKARNFSGNMLTPFACGAYVSWECYPQIKVSLDGRYEVAFREDVLPKHNLFYAAEPGWQTVLDEYPADVILVQQIAPIRQQLESPEAGTTFPWKVVYEDSVFALFARDDARLAQRVTPSMFQTITGRER